MKDFISKMTFGFLMAQLFPGATVVLAAACVWTDKYCTFGASFGRTLSEVGASLFRDALTTAIVVLLAVGVGMCIHGLNWAVLAWLERVAERRGWPSVRGCLWWHKMPILGQLLLSPVFMLVEILWLVWRARLTDLLMQENVPCISKDKMEQFNFLQEFYLHFGQFFAHMAYALLFTTACACACLITRSDGGRLRLAVLFYLSTSVLFLLGRIQLGSLFQAEAGLLADQREKSSSHA